MKKLLAFVFIFSLLGCDLPAPSRGAERNDRPSQKNIPSPQFLVSIEGLELAIKYPQNCVHEKGKEVNKGGSHVYYSFDCTSSHVFLSSLFFQTTSSIKRFEDDCAEGTICFFGDWTDSEDFVRQKEAFYRKQDVDHFVFKKIGDRYYLVQTKNIPEGSALSRRYVSFIDDVRIQFALEWAIPIIGKTMPSGEFQILYQEELEKEADRMMKEEIVIVEYE